MIFTSLVQNVHCLLPVYRTGYLPWKELGDMINVLVSLPVNIRMNRYGRITYWDCF